jgi:hypothetical protein
MSLHTTERTDIDSMIGLIGSDPSETIDIGTDNHLNVDAIIATASLPPLVLPGGYVPKVPNPMPSGPHPMIERAFAAHQNQLRPYHVRTTPQLPYPNTPTPKILAQRPRRRSGFIFIGEMAAMFVLFAIRLTLFAPINLVRAISRRAPKTGHTIANDMRSSPVAMPVRKNSHGSEFLRILFRPITPFAIIVWVSMTGVLTVLNAYGFIGL